MADYTPPLDNIDFVLRHVVDMNDLVADGKFSDLDGETISMVINEAARFIADVVAPVNVDGDEIGAVWSDGEVAVPPSFKSAYKQFVA